MARTGNCTVPSQNVPAEQGKPTKAATFHRLRTQLDTVRKERDLLARDIQLLREENELLKKKCVPNRVFQAALYSDIKIKGVLISDFTRYLPPWKEQLQLLIDTYKLDEIIPKLFVNVKVTTMRWLHSNGENICVNIDELLQQMDLKSDSFGNWIRLNNRHVYDNWNWNYKNNPNFRSF